MSTRRVCLAKISAPHGVKGLVKIIPFGEDPSLLQTLPAYPDPQSAKALRITIKRSAGKHLIAEIEGTNSRNDAEDIRGTELYFDRDQLPETDEDEFYYDDLVALTVIENDHEIGKIKTVQNFGAGDLLEIKPKSGTSFYLPFHDDYICATDIDAGTITVQNTQDFKEE